jgi:hypothetical protein
MTANQESIGLEIVGRRLNASVVAIFVSGGSGLSLTLTWT